MPPSVILCNEQGETVGEEEIVAAHQNEGKLHRAFSVFIFHSNRPSILLQQRSSKKMLWPLIWANTCCSHPTIHESPLQAGQRRLKEEMGFCCELEECGSFVYRATDPWGNGVEHEYDTMLIGMIDDATHIVSDPSEVAEWKWMPIEALREDMKKNKNIYAPWLHIGLEKVLRTYEEKKRK